MKIFFVNSTHKWGGVKTWCLDMAAALRRAGHQACIFGRKGPFLEKAAERGLPARAVHFGPDFNPVLVFRFLGWFLTERPDFVVVNVSKDMRTAGVAARMLGIPVILRVGAPMDFCDTWKVRATLRLVRPRLLTCSEFVRRKMCGHIPMLEGYDFVAIHPGVEIPPSPPQHVHSPRVLIATSQLNPDKGHGELLQAMADLRAKGFGFRCIILGTGRSEVELKAQCTALGLDDVVEWRGFVKNVTEHLREADIFILPTFCEPLGIALEEAMAAGLVPVARRAGGVPEIWPEALRELCFSPGKRVAGLTEALERVLSLPDDMLLSWKEEAWRHAAKSFSVDDQCRKMLAWLRRGGTQSGFL